MSLASYQSKKKKIGKYKLIENEADLKDRLDLEKTPTIVVLH